LAFAVRLVQGEVGPEECPALMEVGCEGQRARLKELLGVTVMGPGREEKEEARTT